MAVAVDDIANRLARRQRLDLLEHRQRPRVGEGRLDEDEVVGHLDGDAVVRAADDEPDAGAEPLDDDALGRAARRLGHVEGHRRVGLHLADDQIEDGVATHRLADAHRELHAAEVAVVGIRRDGPRVEARPGRDRRPGLVPGDLAVQELIVALLSGDRVAAAAERLVPADHDLVAHRGAVVVDRPSHRVHGDLGQAHGDGEEGPRRQVKRRIDLGFSSRSTRGRRQ